jgi:hypothetical protein
MTMTESIDLLILLKDWLGPIALLGAGAYIAVKFADSSI